MNTISLKGIKEADSLRIDLGLNMFQPINIYDACTQIEIDVRFIKVSMEGMYISSDDSSKSNIVLSSLRPFARKVFTCAHELGHHCFGHGSKIDMINNERQNKLEYDEDERLVDVFASSLLMPVAGIQLEFKRRKWDLNSASPIQFFTISSVFGVGYQTLIFNCRINRLISYQKSIELSKYSPSYFLNRILNTEKKVGHLKIIDDKFKENIVDTEVTGFLYLPKGMELEGNHLKIMSETKNGICYQAVRPGILRATNRDSSQAYLIRIQNFEYEGLSEYRHLEN